MNIWENSKFYSKLLVLFCDQHLRLVHGSDGGAMEYFVCKIFICKGQELMYITCSKLTSCSVLIFNLLVSIYFFLVKVMR